MRNLLDRWRLVPLLLVLALGQGCDLCSLTGTSSGCPAKAITKEIQPINLLSITASPNAVTLLPGTSQTVQLTSNSTAQAALTATSTASGVTATLSATTIASTAPVTLTLRAAATIAILPTTETVVVNATASNGLPKTTSVSANVVKPFSLSSQQTLTVTAGAPVDIPLTIARAAAFDGLVAFSVAGLPPNTNGTFTAPSTIAATNTLQLTVPANTTPRAYAVTITGQSGGFHDDLIIVMTVNPFVPTDGITLTASPATVIASRSSSGTSTISITRTGSVGAVTLTAEGLPAGVTFGPEPPTTTGGSSAARFNVGSGVANGDYPITVRGTAGSVSNTTPVTLRVVSGFTMSVAPTALNLATGTFATAAVTINREVSAPGQEPVVLSISGLPAGMQGTFNPPSVSGATSTLTLTAGTVSPGSYTLTITGTANGLTRTTPLQVLVVSAPFTLAANPSPVTVDVASSAATTVTITRPVALSVSLAVVEGLPTEATATFSPPAAAGASSILTITTTRNTPPGTYQLTVRGVGAGIPWQFLLPLVVNAVTDFAVGTSPATTSAFTGTSATSAISILRIGGFSGAVQLTAVSPTTGVTASIAPTSVSGTQNAVLTLNVAANATLGDYVITVRGTSGTVTHTAVVTISVTQYIPPLGDVRRQH